MFAYAWSAAPLWAKLSALLAGFLALAIRVPMGPWIAPLALLPLGFVAFALARPSRVSGPWRPECLPDSVRAQAWEPPDDGVLLGVAHPGRDTVTRDGMTFLVWR